MRRSSAVASRTRTVKGAGSSRKGSSPRRRRAGTGLPLVRQETNSSRETRGMRRVSLLRFWRRGKHAPTEEKNRKRLNTEVTKIGHRGHGDVLVLPEMERWRFPLASIPPFGRGFSRHRYDHQAIPQHGCVPAEPASISPGKIISSSTTSIRLNFRLARHPPDGGLR